MGLPRAPRAPWTARPSASRATAASTCRWTTHALIRVRNRIVEGMATATRASAIAKTGTRDSSVRTLQTHVPRRTAARTGDVSAATVSVKIFTLEKTVSSRQEIPAMSWLCMAASSRGRILQQQLHEDHREVYVFCVQLIFIKFCIQHLIFL